MAESIKVVCVCVLLATAVAACADFTTEPPEENVEVTRIEVVVESEVIAVGGTSQLTATAFNSLGEDVTGTTEFVWSSEPRTVLRVDQDGLATGISDGQATVTAVVNEVRATVEIEVGPPPAPGG